MSLKRVAIALVALLALTGCTEIGSLSDKAQIDLALQNLTTELDELAGIQTDYTAELQGDYSYRVEVHATAPQLDTEQLAAAAVLVRDELGSGVFERTAASFDLTLPEGMVFGIWTFDITDDELRDTLALAEQLSDAYGSTATLTIGEEVSIGVLTAASSPDWDAIRTIVDNGGQQYWGFPGLTFEGAMPPVEVTDLVDAIGTVLPLDFDGEIYVSADWYGDSLVVTVAASGVDVADPTASTVWPQAVEVATLIAASPLTGRSFMFYGLDNQGIATVFFGDCAESVPPAEADSVLAAALGMEATPGQCL